ncbi:trypsin-like peptidase domain-containing protein [Massilia atriviolacea]|uniref:Serine protease n=1 Tax=Massilia atriviolacea TaxID=2495579 RepID=A0A430HP42_9BURK|nr:serine protease [Massilia atriviolacea]RSZ59306.1 serine protease [Massilia atriviolacea]
MTSSFFSAPAIPRLIARFIARLIVPFLRACLGAGLAGALLLAPGAAAAASFGQVIQAVKPSVVGIGTYQPTRSPAIVFVATGFVTGDGLSVVTNAHGIPDTLDSERNETLGIVIAKGDKVDFRPARLAGLDRQHDLAHLRLAGAPLPALRLGDGATAEEGQALAFTGFPLGMVLGLHPVTHRAMLSAITPLVMPSLSSRKLDARAITQLSRAPSPIYQLDGTAYPGNSGSPVYDPESGEVLAVLNMVFVKGLKENAITNPSGISYAIPVRHVRALLQQTAAQSAP